MKGAGRRGSRPRLGETKTLATGGGLGKVAGDLSVLPLFVSMKRLISLSRTLLGLFGLLAAAAAVIAAEPKAASPGDHPPKTLKQVSPVYPYFRKRAGLIGVVRIRFVIDKEGRVIDPVVAESNNPWFERPAIDAILQWKFEPAVKNGQPVNTRSGQEFVFSLDGGGQAPELWRVVKGKDHGKLPLEFRWETPAMPKMTLFPVYPFEQLQAGVEGKAVINYIVGPKGEVVRANVREATTPEFGLAAMAMIDAWRFNPAKSKEGQPVYANLNTEYAFRTNGQGDVPVSDEAKWILSDLKKKPEVIATAADLDQPPKPISRRPPVYPTALRAAGQSGSAMIEFYIDRNGDAQLPRVVSATAPEFGYAAVLAVATWRFEVPLKKKKPVVTRVQVPVDFKFNEPKNTEKIPELPATQP